MSKIWPIVHDVEEKTDGRWIERDTSEEIAERARIKRDIRELRLILAGCAAFWFACGMLFMVWLGR